VDAVLQEGEVGYRVQVPGSRKQEPRRKSRV
jgi:hypothetical protein